MASVIAARRTLNVEPVWNQKFFDITGYNFEEIEECYCKLYAKYEHHFKKFQKKQEVNLDLAKTKSHPLNKPPKLQRKNSSKLT